MRFRFFCALLGLAMGWMIAEASVNASYAPKIEPRSHRQPPVVYTPGRLIGLLKQGSTCPTVAGWKVQSLSELATAHAEDGVRKPYGEYAAPARRTAADRTRQAKADRLFRKHGLDRFCVYTGKGKKFQKPAELSNVVPDRMALTPNAPTELGFLGDQTWESLAGRFLNQVGKIRLGPAEKKSVRLVFVDTQPTGEGPPAKLSSLGSLHGYGMAQLGNEMVCGHDSSPQDCPIQIATRLALRYDRFDSAQNSPDDPGSDAGGPQGRLGDLAVAILAEIEHWQTTAPDTKLILNLSIGWDGETKDLDANREADLEASAKAVYDALQYAHDLGVLVIAAAGNRSGGEDSQWPLLPAAWELRPPAWTTFGPKVVYAVGGVDWQGLPLSNARPAGMPSRVAYADHAVVRTSNGNGEPSKVYTGSSVAAVVASSTAAVLWHLRPDLKPAQIMHRMTAAAEAFPSTATFYALKPLTWMMGGPPQLKRLSLCRTLSSVCGLDGHLCPGVDPNDCRCGDYLPADFSRIAPHTSDGISFTAMDPSPSCDPATKVFMNAGNLGPDSNNCPIETVPDINTPSTTGPQPPDTPCPTCMAVPDKPQTLALTALALRPNLMGSDSEEEDHSYSVAVALDPEWLQRARSEGTTIKSSVLVVDCPLGATTKMRFDITSEVQKLYSSTHPDTDSKKLSFGRIGARKSLVGCRASVDFTLSLTDATERSVQSPTYVAR